MSARPTSRRPGWMLLAVGTLAGVAVIGVFAGPRSAGDAMAPPDRNLSADDGPTASRDTTAWPTGDPTTRTPVDVPVAAAAPPEATAPRERRTHTGDSILPGIAPPSAASAELHAIPRSVIPRDIYERLMERLAQGERNAAAMRAAASVPPSPVDPSATSNGLERPLGAARNIGGGRADTVPVEAQARLRERAAAGETTKRKE